MGIFDEVKDKAQDVLNDPDKRAKIEQMAKDKGISIDQAKDHFMKHGEQ